MKLEKELVAASSVPLVLSILSEGDNYGYAIIQRVKELSGGKIEWTDGMLFRFCIGLKTKASCAVAGQNLRLAEDASITHCDQRADRPYGNRRISGRLSPQP